MNGLRGVPQPLTDLTQAEVDYLRLVRAFGVQGPTLKRLDLQEEVADDGQTDCWTHAWQVARETGATYVEGLCFRPDADGPSFHAWVEEDNPLTGRTLVETTKGYEDATRYLGIPVDNTPGGTVDMVTGDWEIRSSVLQAALAANVPYARVLEIVSEGGR